MCLSAALKFERHALPVEPSGYALERGHGRPRAAEGKRTLRRSSKDNAPVLRDETDKPCADGVNGVVYGNLTTREHVLAMLRELD